VKADAAQQLLPGACGSILVLIGRGASRLVNMAFYGFHSQKKT
jgi:hypothetical protein